MWNLKYLEELQIYFTHFILLYNDTLGFLFIKLLFN